VVRSSYVRLGGLIAVAYVLSFVTGCGQTAAVTPGSNAEASESAPVATPEAATGTDQTGTDQMGTANRPTNRLAQETSPYLLMHAHNPVDWYPWGEEALAKAKRENKLIFLSVGYSSCYWCHRMEREVFMNAEIAKYLNDNFVCIKVDREERPDIDDVYMLALQVYNQLTNTGGSGGWPMSMFLTPDAKPFAGGTYFPADQFTTIVERLRDLWDSQPDTVNKMANGLTDIVDRSMRERNEGEKTELTTGILNDVRAAIAETYDPQYGGFGFSEASDRQPKFPDHGNLVFLLDMARRQQDEQARDMVLFTLDKIAQGGIHDHLGGGFHRYSTDRYWSVPHFEKMLYDQGQLASVYASAYELTQNEIYRVALERMLEFVRREMLDESGGFYSALDAETHEEEGRFYIWTHDELDQALDDEEFEFLAKVYAIDGQPQMEDFYVLQGAKPWKETLESLGFAPAQPHERLAPIQAKLMAARSQRERPLTDTKILTSWNGLMIRGFADAGRILESDGFVNTARKAAEFVLANLRTPDGRLLRTSTAGQAKLNAYLDDYAFLVDGLIGLHQATGDARWLEDADRLMAKQIELHWDAEGAGFFYTSNDHEKLIARGKNPVDSATPSENAVSALNLLYLARHLERPEYRDKAKAILDEFSPMFAQAPGAVPRLAVALAEWLDEGDTAAGRPE
jgi:uncharacterized protein YyaL (SSP411 family)